VKCRGMGHVSNMFGKRADIIGGYNSGARVLFFVIPCIRVNG